MSLSLQLVGEILGRRWRSRGECLLWAIGSLQVVDLASLYGEGLAAEGVNHLAEDGVVGDALRVGHLVKSQMIVFVYSAADFNELALGLSGHLSYSSSLSAT